MWKLSRATVQRCKAAAGAPASAPGKRGPRTTLDDQALLAGIRGVLDASPFVGGGYRKVWARLRQQHGIRTSMRRVLRIMRAHGLLASQRPTAIRGPQVHEGTIVTQRPDQMWAIDATGCVADEGNATVFVLVDHCTGECLGVRAAPRDTRFEAIECVLEEIWATKGPCEVGIASSPSFVRQPEGNGCVERFIRTLKEQLLWLRRFRTVEELGQALRDFAQRFNNHWIIGRIGYRTSAQHRRELLVEAA
jgi:putative transposase